MLIAVNCQNILEIRLASIRIFVDFYTAKNGIELIKVYVKYAKCAPNEFSRKSDIR
jgi:hypothetical protein